MKKERVSKKSERIFGKEVILETPHFKVGQDWEVAIPGFYIIAPKRKGVRSILEFTPEELSEYVNILARVRKGMQDVLGIEEVYQFQNEDSPYGFHHWMLPYHPWMEKITPRGPGALVPIWNHAKNNLKEQKHIQETVEAAAKMRKYLSK